MANGCHIHFAGNLEPRLKGLLQVFNLVNTLWVADFRNHLRLFVTAFLIRGSTWGAVRGSSADGTVETDG